jgi:hypothetical protein
MACHSPKAEANGKQLASHRRHNDIMRGKIYVTEKNTVLWKKKVLAFAAQRRETLCAIGITVFGVWCFIYKMASSCFGCAKVPVQAGSAFRADSLGNSILHPAPAKRLLRKEALCKEQLCFPYEFEREVVPGFMATPIPPTDPPSNPSTSIRIVKSVPYYGQEATVSIGSGLSTFTWEQEGFVLFGTKKTVILTAATSIGQCNLNVPRGIVVSPDDGSIIVVGSGYITNLAGDDLPLQPAVARVDPVTLSVFVQVGNGSNGLYNEEYNDVQLDVLPTGFCDQPVNFIVCGLGSESVDGNLQAVFRRLNGSTLLPVPIANTAKSYAIVTDSLLVGPNEFVSSRAVSLAASVKLDLIVVAVQATILYADDETFTSSLLWSLSLSGESLVPLSVTSFNNPATFFLRTPANVGTLSIVSVVISSCGNTFAVSAGTTTPGAPLPLYVTVVHAFNLDTDPIQDFGVSGITTWFDPTGASSRPVGATTPSDGSLIVVGNSFSDAVITPDVAGNDIVAPSLPWLNVSTALSLSPSYQLGSSTTPFLIRLNCSGIACSLLRALPCDPCVSFYWASAFVMTSAMFGFIIGDVAKKPLAPSQPAGLLSMSLRLSLSSNSVKITNTGRPAVREVFTSASCDGVIYADSLCAPTTLVVNGPVVVGDNNVDIPPLAGAIKFQDGVFLGYDGTNWVQFTTVVPP